MDVNKLVVHHSASSRDTTTVEMITAWHKKRGFSGIGYHKVILGNGAIRAGRSEKKMGAHALGANANSLGVCLTGNFEKESPSEAQIKSLQSVLESWCRTYHLKASMIYPHCTVPGGKTKTACPGKNLLSKLPDIRAEVDKWLPKYPVEVEIVDPGVQRALRLALSQDSKISYEDVLSLISAVIKDGRIYPHELADMKRILSNAKSLDAGSVQLITNFLKNPSRFAMYGVANQLTFNGRVLAWYGPGGILEKSWPAVSGRPGSQEASKQGLANKGPIPAGTWDVRQSEYQKMPDRSVFTKILAELGRTAWPGGESAWGRNRIWLHPRAGTNVFGRSGFSIHGGDTPGSAGCIDLTSNMADFTKKFLAFGKDLVLTVKY